MLRRFEGGERGVAEREPSAEIPSGARDLSSIWSFRADVAQLVEHSLGKTLRQRSVAATKREDGHFGDLC